MEYGYIRKLAKGVPDGPAADVAALLLEEGIEVYALDDGGVELRVPEAGVELRVPEAGVGLCVPEAGVGAHVPEAGVESCVPEDGVGPCVPEAGVGSCVPEERRDGARYVLADASARFPNGDIYVPAADRGRAAELLEQAGAVQYLCEDPLESLELTEAEKLQADMIRRQRRNMVICLAVMVLAAIYYLFFS